MNPGNSQDQKERKGGLTSYSYLSFPPKLPLTAMAARTRQAGRMTKKSNFFQIRPLILLDDPTPSLPGAKNKTKMKLLNLE